MVDGCPPLPPDFFELQKVGADIYQEMKCRSDDENCEYVWPGQRIKRPKKEQCTNDKIQLIEGEKWTSGLDTKAALEKRFNGITGDSTYSKQKSVEENVDVLVVEKSWTK